MYPNLYYLFRDWFGVELNGLRFIHTFGFFVALSFIAAAVVLTSELKRKALSQLGRERAAIDELDTNPMGSSKLLRALL